MKVTSLEQLSKLCQERKAVYCPESFVWQKPRPAGFMINLQGRELLRLFQLGMYVYDKPVSFLDIEV